MTHIRRTCQEIRDIKNPLRSRKSKLINKVYSRPPGPNHGNSTERLQDKYGEGVRDGSDSSYSTPTHPLDQWRNPCTNQGDGEHFSSPLPSPTPHRHPLLPLELVNQFLQLHPNRLSWARHLASLTSTF